MDPDLCTSPVGQDAHLSVHGMPNDYLEPSAVELLRDFDVVPVNVPANRDGDVPIRHDKLAVESTTSAERSPIERQAWMGAPPDSGWVLPRAILAVQPDLEEALGHHAVALRQSSPMKEAELIMILALDGGALGVLLVTEHNPISSFRP